MALRTHRDRAMVLGMLLAGLRRCEVLGLRFGHVQVADRRLVVTEGKGTRPAELDCRMESACETCAYFRTSTEYLPILARQRDHGQTARADLFSKIIQNVEQIP